MKHLSLVALLCTVACARAEEAGACALAGELRCADDGDQLMACASDGAWHGVRNCSDTHELCHNGHCIFDTSTFSSSCDVVGARGCSEDCEFIELCSSSGNWVDIEKCGSGTICVNGKCVSSATNFCHSSGKIKCGDHSVGVVFPNLEDCSSYFLCQEEWAAPLVKHCGSGYYDPCSGTCSLTSPTPCKHYKPCSKYTDGFDAAIAENPALHYTCASDTTVFKKCPRGSYDQSEGECIGTGAICQV